jgi:hypothetical protein
MSKTIEAVVDKDGYIRIPDSVTLERDQRVLVTILEDDEDHDEPNRESRAAATAIMSEEVLAEDWTREEEDEAWTHLQPDQ